MTTTPDTKPLSQEETIASLGNYGYGWSDSDVAGASAKARFRHYLNLDRMQARLDRLLGDFSWGRMDQAFFKDAPSRN